MTVLQQFRYAQRLLWVAALVAAVAIVVFAPRYWIVAPLILIAAGLSRRHVGSLLIKVAYRQLARDEEAEQFADARRRIAELTEVYRGSRSALEHLRIREAGILSLESRYSDAAALLASIDLAALQHDGWRALVLNNLAWSLALSGEAGRATEVARQSMSASDRAGDRTVLLADLRACQLGTLGTALVLSGSAAEGITHLEQALARGGTPRQQASRFFFLGEGLRDLGRTDEAMAAYRNAIAQTPQSEFGRKASARLEEGNTSASVANAG
jgi:tetratricopeptide (TPR) repeat protein